ncbi:hypothetical protein AYL99_04484 [Fonsecaea erecta]|uniref:Uncharacterized protein n=1 Tax=Fonsecaea erecta TaxID=1367422 RepID=A0A178ZS66_9EURO|nr:hypothetical protein AYL99_04484 [Fonsecaea erecta]OAP62281.1 hypothetical protein AYL99_04484 [Fonsecaea erecta]
MTTKTFTPSAGWPFSTPVVVSVPCSAPAVSTSTVPTPGGTWSSKPVSLAPTVTAGSWGGNPVSPVAAASTGAWVSPSVTVATTLTVAPVQSSSAWVAAASTSPAAPVAPYSIPINGTNSWVAPYTGAAAGRTTLSAWAMVAAGAVALGALVM